MQCHNFIESGVKSASGSLLPILSRVLGYYCVRCQRVEVCPVLSVEQVSLLLSPDAELLRRDSPNKDAG